VGGVMTLSIGWLLESETMMLPLARHSGARAAENRARGPAPSCNPLALAAPAIVVISSARSTGTGVSN
jgi:hypothetical protein